MSCDNKICGVGKIQLRHGIIEILLGNLLVSVAHLTKSLAVIYPSSESCASVYNIYI